MALKQNLLGISGTETSPRIRNGDHERQFPKDENHRPKAPVRQSKRYGISRGADSSSSKEEPVLKRRKNDRNSRPGQWPETVIDLLSGNTG